MLETGISCAESAAMIGQIPHWLWAAGKGTDTSPLGTCAQQCSVLMVTDCCFYIEITGCLFYGLSEENSVLSKAGRPSFKYK